MCIVVNFKLVGTCRTADVPETGKPKGIWLEEGLGITLRLEYGVVDLLFSLVCVIQGIKIFILHSAKMVLSVKTLKYFLRSWKNKYLFMQIA